MPTYFADTSFWIALIEAGDAYHEPALEWEHRIVSAGAPMVTSEPVLWEVLSFSAAPPSRAKAIALYQALHRRPQVEVIGFRPDFQAGAIDLYTARHDKAWSIVDCYSFEVMRLRAIRDALTSDHHFEQAGFVAHLRRPSP